MAFDKPFDLAIVFGIFALVVVTALFGLESVSSKQGIEGNTSFFTAVENNINSNNGLHGTAADLSSGVTGQEEAGTTVSEDSLLTDAFNRMRDLGKTWLIVEDSLDELTKVLPIDPIYILTVTSMLLIAFVVVLYTWLRGR